MTTITPVWGQVDINEVERRLDFGFGGVEMTLISDEARCGAVAAVVQRRQGTLGAHYPLVWREGIERFPTLLHPDQRARQQAISAVARELEYARSFGADYLVVHFPKPSVFPNPR